MATVARIHSRDPRATCCGRRNQVAQSEIISKGLTEEESKAGTGRAAKVGSKAPNVHLRRFQPDVEKIPLSSSKNTFASKRDFGRSTSYIISPLQANTLPNNADP